MKQTRRLFSRVALVLVGALALVHNAAQAHADGHAQGAAERVVSIDGSITEIVYALGAQDQLVGVDTTSRFPEAATQLPDVGYMRRLSTEGILSLNPTLVIATQDAGPERVFEQLVDAGVSVQRIHNRYTLNGVLDKIDRVAAVLGKAEQGKQLQQRIRQQTDQALSRIPTPTPTVTPPRTLFLLGAGDRGLMAAGQGTQAAAMMTLVKAENVVVHPGYKPLSPEGALTLSPEVVLAAHTGAGDHGPSPRLDQTLAMTPAQQNQRVHAVDVSLVLGFGPRIADAVNQLVDLLYPARVADAR